jgi:hypothetical protein
MPSSPPTRLDADVYRDAAAVASSTSRSTAQQLSHWARLGRELEATVIMATRRRALAAVLGGQGGYDDLTEDEQAVVRTAWQERIDDLLDRVDVGQQRLNDGKTYLALDDDGAIVRHWPDGTVETL